MDKNSPGLNLLAGTEVLNPVLRPHGFTFQIETEGKGSGGAFASGSYHKADRRLELHFRQSLGMVTYHIGADSLDHESYMRLLGAHGKSRYPDFPQEPLGSFVHLAHDIENYCSDFLSGDGLHFHSFAKSLRLNPNMFKGIGAL